MKFEPKLQGEEPHLRLRGGADPDEKGGCWAEIKECLKGDQGKYRGTLAATMINPDPNPVGFTLGGAGTG